MRLSRHGAKLETISCKLAAISYWHKENQLPSPCSMKADRQLAQVYAGIRKTTGTMQEGNAAGTLSMIPEDCGYRGGLGPLTASRDRALILIGFARGLPRWELAGILFEHLQPHAQGSPLRFPSRRPTKRGREGKSTSPRGSQPEHRLPECTYPVARSTSGCARPASRVGRCSARSTARKTCKKPP